MITVDRVFRTSDYTRAFGTKEIIGVVGEIKEYPVWVTVPYSYSNAFNWRSYEAVRINKESGYKPSYEGSGVISRRVESVDEVIAFLEGLKNKNRGSERYRTVEGRFSFWHYITPIEGEFTYSVEDDFMVIGYSEKTLQKSGNAYNKRVFVEKVETAISKGDMSKVKGIRDINRDALGSLLSEDLQKKIIGGVIDSITDDAKNLRRFYEKL